MKRNFAIFLSLITLVACYFTYYGPTVPHGQPWFSEHGTKHEAFDLNVFNSFDNKKEPDLLRIQRERVAYAERDGLESSYLSVAVFRATNVCFHLGKPLEAKRLLSEFIAKCENESDNPSLIIRRTIFRLRDVRQRSEDWRPHLLKQLVAHVDRVASSRPEQAAKTEFSIIESFSTELDEKQISEFYVRASNRLKDTAPTNKEHRIILIDGMCARELWLEKVGRKEEADAIANKIGEWKDYDR